MAASVPLLTSLTSSQPGTLAQISSASRTSPGVGAPNVVPSPGGLPDRLDDLGVGVAQDRGPVGLDVVDVAVALDVGDVGALRRGPRSTACRQRP